MASDRHSRHRDTCASCRASERAGAHVCRCCGEALTDTGTTFHQAAAELRIRWDAFRETVALLIHPETSRALDEGMLGLMVNDLADAKVANAALRREVAMLRAVLDGIDASAGPRHVGAARRLVSVANANADLRAQLRDAEDAGDEARVQAATYRQRIRELEAAIAEHQEAWDQSVAWSGIPGDLTVRYGHANRELWAALEGDDHADT